VDFIQQYPGTDKSATIANTMDSEASANFSKTAYIFLIMNFDLQLKFKKGKSKKKYPRNYLKMYSTYRN
jgi:hypothetical protein